MDITDEVAGLLMAAPDLKAGREFVESLIDGGHLMSLSEPIVGALVTYYAAGWTHMGVVQERLRIKSKWGLYPAYEHDLWAVPASYGDEVRYFARPSPETSGELFRKYVAGRGRVPKMSETG